MLDDDALLRRYVTTHVEADFAELVRRHIDGVYSAALRRLGGDTHLAKDVTQQVFSALAQNAASLSRHPVLAGWLYTTTRNQAVNAVRTERRRQAREREAQIMSKFNTEPVVEADWGRVAPVLDAVIDQLSESDRTAVLLRFIERRPFGEIGAVLRLTEDAARMRIDRALEKLRILLKRRGIISSSAALEAAMASHAVSAAPSGLAINVAGTALAAGPSVLAATTSLVNIMSTIKSATGLATMALIIAALGTTGYVLREARQRWDGLEAAKLALAADQLSLQRLAKDDQAAESRLAALRTAAATNTADSIPATLGAGIGGPASGENSDASKFLRAYPQARKMIMDAEKPQLEHVYGAFFRSAGLTAEQVSRLESALQEASLQDLGITADGEIHLSLLQEPTDQLAQILGDQAYRQFREYQRLLPAQTVAQSVAVEAAYGSAALSSDQVEQLTRIVASSSAAYQNGGGVDLGGVDWNSVLTQAAAALSPEQAQALQNQVQKFRYQSALAQARQNQAAPAQ